MVGTVKRLATALAILLAPFLLLAQEIYDFKYQLVDKKIEITYTLSGQPSDRYEVRLYNSLDNFTIPLTLVSGDIGLDIIPGKDKRIIWDARNALGEFKGNLSLKLKTRFIPFITFNIAKGAKFKRGKSQDVSWESSKSNKVNLELYQGNNKISDLAALSSAKAYKWSIPKKMALGKDYKIKATGDGRMAYSEPFSINRKVPMAFWIVPAVVVVGAIVFIIPCNGCGEDPKLIPEPLGPN